MHATEYLYHPQLLSIADEADQVLIDITFQKLDEVIEKVCKSSCVQANQDSIVWCQLPNVLKSAYMLIF